MLSRRRKYNTRRKNRRRTSRVVKGSKSRKYKKLSKMIGGTFSDLTHMDPSSKTIILMGEEHTIDVLGDTSKYDVIERKQKAIIDFVIEKFTGKHIMFYSEAPNDARHVIMEDKSRHSSRVIQYASTKMPIQLSHVTACHRESDGSCDDRYASEILKIIKDGTDCVIVQIGLLHVPYIRDLIQASAKDVRIVIINTVSQEMLTRSERNINEKYPKVAELLKTEPPYDLPRYSANIVKNESGVDVYECPVCKALSSPAAVFVPTNASYFIHNPGCENATKVPTSESRISRTSQASMSDYLSSTHWTGSVGTSDINYREQALKKMEETSRKFSNGHVEEFD
jgi:hypothetical protein